MIFFAFSSLFARPIPLPEALSLLDSNSPAVQLSRLSEKRVQQESIVLLEKLFPQVQIEASTMYFGEPLEVNLLAMVRKMLIALLLMLLEWENCVLVSLSRWSYETNKFLMPKPKSYIPSPHCIDFSRIWQ